MRAELSGAILLAATGIMGSALSAHADTVPLTWWQPTTSATQLWDWQLATPVTISGTNGNKIYVIDIDMWENIKADVDRVRIATPLPPGIAGRKVICYVDAGSWENWRPDAAQFPASVLGKTYSGFPDERWFDIRPAPATRATDPTEPHNIMRSRITARFQKAHEMGCDGVEPDNIDGYDTTAHGSTGFPLTYEDQMNYNLFLAATAHGMGMAIGLKNDINQAGDNRTLDNFDFVISEQCAQYNECTYFYGFLNRNKPVYDAEYKALSTTYCTRTKSKGIAAIRKDTSLSSKTWAACP